MTPELRTHTGREIVGAARAYVGTPVHRQGRMKGVGVDCVGLIICSAADLGLDVVANLRSAGFSEDEFQRYSRTQSFANLFAMLEAVAIQHDRAALGDVLLFKIPHARSPHVGIKSERGMIHAFDKIGRVTEHGINDVWRRVTHSAWRLKGVE